MLKFGDQFNKWTVIEFFGRDKKSNQLYLCKCSCGKENKLRKSTLVSNDSMQCKTCRMNEHNKITDIIGQRFGNCIVIKRLDNKNSQSCYLVRCDCGREKNALGYRLKDNKSTKCPHCRVKTHGMSYTSTFRIWTGILRRCLNPNFKHYKYYGGRGITVIDRWMKFEDFLEDMGIRPVGLTIDRINNDGNYEPGNCRWVTPKENNLNRRKPIKKELSHVIPAVIERVL